MSLGASRFVILVENFNSGQIKDFEMDGISATHPVLFSIL